MQSLDKFTIIIPPEDIGSNPDCLQRFAAGDRKAFDWIYKNYCGKVYQYARLLTADEHLSEDLVQDIFVRLWTKREKLKHVKNFNAYLYITTRNITASVVNRQKMEKFKRLGFVNELNFIESYTEERLDQKQFSNLLSNAIMQLPPQQKLTYKLRKEGWDRKRIANALNVELSTIKTHLKKGLISLEAFMRKKIS